MIQFPTLTIAGFDNSGGAGLQADLKTFSAFGCYGMSVVTAIAAQNTVGVKQCYMIPLDVIETQLTTIFDDIRPKAIKIGMLFNSEIISLIANFLRKNAENIPIVIDPVMIAKSGDTLLQNDAIHALQEVLLPLGTLITPNIPEALKLINGNRSLSQQEIADKMMLLNCNAVLIKGGHYSSDNSEDLLKTKDQEFVFSTKRIDTKNSHGTGCTLSAAITALLAQNFSLEDSVRLGKDYLTKALQSAKIQSVGNGSGPTDHLWYLDTPCNNKLNK